MCGLLRCLPGGFLLIGFVLTDIVFFFFFKETCSLHDFLQVLGTTSPLCTLCLRVNSISYPSLIHLVPLHLFLASLIAQLVKNPPAMQETLV